MNIRSEYVWLAAGIVGQGFFFSRFLVQWIASEPPIAEING